MKAMIRDSLPRKTKDAIKREVRSQVYAQKKRINADFDAMVLWVLHEKFGFGRERLRRFYDAFVAEVHRLDEAYQMGGETGYVCRVKLKEIGVDVEAWNDET